MPICTVVDGPNNTVPLTHLEIFCKEIVPAALRDNEHKLNPGDVQIIVFGGEKSSLTVGTLLKIEAEPSEKRSSSNRRLSIIKKITEAYLELFPDASLVVALYFSLDGYHSTHPVEMPKVEDMSIKAAIVRAREQIAALNAEAA